MTPGLRAAGGAFLVAVLVCDLTFDLPVWRARTADPVAQDGAFGDTTRYYRRITTKGSLLARSVAVVMTAMLASIAHGFLSRPNAEGLARFAVESVFALGPVVLAATRTFPNARRLATGEGDVATRIELARSIGRDHVVALPAMLTYVVTQLVRL